mmetsp:Transcript_27778/g.33973  ORF Transcript_27778/g.33973 Transcript_27778/m.33973 type:complete len:118 (-) Transcript_27778:722-1075(-)
MFRKMSGLSKDQEIECKGVYQKFGGEKRKVQGGRDTGKGILASDLGAALRAVGLSGDLHLVTERVQLRENVNYDEFRALVVEIREDMRRQVLQQDSFIEYNRKPGRANSGGDCCIVS